MAKRTGCALEARVFYQETFKGKFNLMSSLAMGVKDYENEAVAPQIEVIVYARMSFTIGTNTR